MKKRIISLLIPVRYHIPPGVCAATIVKDHTGSLFAYKFLQALAGSHRFSQVLDLLTSSHRFLQLLTGSHRFLQVFTGS
jgi:hypothetical protein